MIYQRNLIKELTLTAIGIFFILLAILIFTQLINLLGRAADGRIAIDAIGTMVAVWVIGLTPLLLILTAFISILTVLIRYWYDSEMTVWLACGLSLKKWITPVMSFSIPFAILIAIMSLHVNPWAESRGSDFSQILKQRQDISLIKQGTFSAIQDKKAIYFVEKFDPQSGYVENIFIREHDDQRQRLYITLAKKGYLKTEDNNRVLILEEGSRYSGQPGQADFIEAHFPSAKFIIAAEPKIIRQDANRKQASTLELWQSNDTEFKGELMWRMSMPICVLILSLLAIPLSYSNPRTGKTYNILLAILLFFVYQNGLSILRSLIVDGHINLWLGFLPMHIIMLCISIALLHYRSLPAAPLLRQIKSKRT